MRLLIGTSGGLYTVRWVHGERAAQIERREFEGRDVTAVASTERALYATVSGYGIFRSDDRAATWKQMLGELDGHRVRTLSISPRSDSVIYVGTEPPAVHVSRDGGQTWDELREFRVMGVREGWRDYGHGAAHVRTIACDPHDARRLYAGVAIGGAYRSDSAGANWLPVNEGIFDDIHELVVDPREGSRVYAATGGGFQISEDRGAHWRRHDSELGGLYCTRFEAVLDPDLTRSLLVLATAAGPPGTWEGRRGNAHPRLHVSRDAGESWEQFDTAGMAEKGAFTALASDPTTRQAGFIGTSSGRLYYGNVRLGRWSKILFGIPAVRTLRIV